MSSASWHRPDHLGLDHVIVTFVCCGFIASLLLWCNVWTLNLAIKRHWGCLPLCDVQVVFKASVYKYSSQCVLDICSPLHSQCLQAPHWPLLLHVFNFMIKTRMWNLKSKTFSLALLWGFSKLPPSAEKEVCQREKIWRLYERWIYAWTRRRGPTN